MLKSYTVFGLRNLSNELYQFNYAFHQQVNLLSTHGLGFLDKHLKRDSYIYKNINLSSNYKRRLNYFHLIKQNKKEWNEFINDSTYELNNGEIKTEKKQFSQQLVYTIKDNISLRVQNFEKQNSHQSDQNQHSYRHDVIKPRLFLFKNNNHVAQFFSQKQLKKFQQSCSEKEDISAQAIKRCNRKQLGYGAQTKRIFRNKAHTTKKATFVLEFMICKKKRANSYQQIQYSHSYGYQSNQVRMTFFSLDYELYSNTLLMHIFMMFLFVILMISKTKR